MTAAEEASASLYNAIAKKTDGLIAIECRDLPNRQPPSLALVVLLSDKATPVELPGEWMGYHVSQRVLNADERKALREALLRDSPR